jgi:hypothetical protein
MCGPRSGVSWVLEIWYVPAVIVPVAAGSMLTVTVRLPVAPAARDPARVQTTVPVAPTPGPVHAAPAGPTTPCSVVFGGVVKSMTTPVSAAADPFL